MCDVKLTEKEIKDGAGFAALSYVFFLWILVFLFKKDNEFAHYHAKQGLVIFIAEIVVFAFLSFLPLIGVVFKVAGIIVFPVCCLYGVYSSLIGKAANIPGVSAVAARLVV